MVKKAVKIIWDLEALKQFKDILTYLEEHSVQAPNIVKKAILERIESLEENPFIFAN